MTMTEIKKEKILLFTFSPPYESFFHMFKIMEI
jgi:hypothetical protein